MSPREFLAVSIKSGVSARAFVAAAYVTARGWLTHVTRPDDDFERLYAAVGAWDDPERVVEAARSMDAIRTRLLDFSRHGIRDVRALGGRLEVGEAVVSVATILGGLSKAIGARCADLREAGSAASD